MLVGRVTLAGMAGRVRVREIDDDEGNRLKRIVRRGSGWVVTWRRAQMVLWSAQGMSVAQIAGLAFTSEDRVRDVLHNFSADGFDSLYPRYAGGRPPVFTLGSGGRSRRSPSPPGPIMGCRSPGGAWNCHTADPRLRRVVKRANADLRRQGIYSPKSAWTSRSASATRATEIETRPAGLGIATLNP